jgi:hypothetical protein
MVAEMKKTIFLLLISFCIVIASTTSYAAETNKDGDTIVIRSLDEYHGRGTIDGIYANRIVINDSSIEFSSEPILRNMEGEELELYQIKAGMSVYFFFDDNNDIAEMLVE